MLSCFSLILIAACGDSGDKVAQLQLSDEVNLEVRDSTFLIKEGGMNFQITLPANILVHGAPTMKFNAASGHYEIQDATERLWLQFFFDERPLTEILEHLNHNTLFRIEWVTNKDNQAIWNRYLPDGTLFDQMFMSILNSSTQRIIVVSSPEGEFSVDDIQKMLSIVSTVKLLS